MLMLPAHSSASPPVITASVLPKELSPAVRAKGTVMPSEKPSVKSDKKRLNAGPCDDFIWAIAILGNSELKALGTNLNKEFDNTSASIDQLSGLPSTNTDNAAHLGDGV